MLQAEAFLGFVPGGEFALRDPDAHAICGYYVVAWFLFIHVIHGSSQSGLYGLKLKSSGMHKSILFTLPSSANVTSIIIPILSPSSFCLKNRANVPLPKRKQHFK